MPNSNQEFWTLNDVSLQQYGWAVTTFGGARYDLPPRRGDNVTLAYRPGQVFRPKQPDQRVITLTMFLVGMVPGTGANPPNADHTLQFNDSWDFLRRLVWQANDKPCTLTRRWELTSATQAIPAGQSTLPGLLPAGARIVPATASAEMSGTMTPTMTGRQRADFQMDFTLADPYFYGAPITATVPNNGSLFVYNSGNDTVAHSHLSVEFHGPLTNPILSNLSPEPDLWLKYTGTISGSVTMDIGNFNAIAGNGINQSGNISHKGARHWFGLQPGLNKLTLTGTGSGYATVTWSPPYV